MRNAAWLGLLVLLAFCGPVAAAGVGTEDLPELSDRVGDVEYSPLYNGPKNHDYLDVVAAWFDHDPAADNITLHVKVPSAENLTASQSQWAVSFLAQAHLTLENETKGEVRFSFNSLPRSTGKAEDSWVAYTRSGGSEPKMLRSSFQVERGTPGYYRWSLGRSQLMDLGTDLKNLGVDSNEFLAPGGFPTAVNNGDSATSSSDYSMVELRRIAGPDGAPDDLASLNSRLPPVSTSATTEPSKGSPGIGIVVSVAAIGAALMLARRRPS
jgi:PGF-CTERM protein